MGSEVVQGSKKLVAQKILPLLPICTCVYMQEKLLINSI